MVVGKVRKKLEEDDEVALGDDDVDDKEYSGSDSDDDVSLIELMCEKLCYCTCTTCVDTIGIRACVAAPFVTCALTFTHS